MCSHINHADPNNLVISEGLCQWYHYSNECYGFFTHSENSSEKTEKQHHADNNDIADSDLAYNSKAFKSMSLGDELHYPLIYSLRTVDYPECPSDDQHESYYSCLTAESFIESRQYLPGLGIASRNKPCRQSTYRYYRKNYYICIRNSYLSHK